MQKIFLTGESGVGKSYIINKIKDRQDTIGFKTFFDTGRKTLFIRFSGGESFPVGYRDEGKMKPVLFGFERAACIIEQLQPDDRLLIVDEIGILEENCYKFKIAFEKLLDRSSKVLCVLRSGETPFISQLKSRSDFELLKLKKDSRNETLKNIFELFE